MNKIATMPSASSKKSNACATNNVIVESLDLTKVEPELTEKKNPRQKRIEESKTSELKP